MKPKMKPRPAFAIILRAVRIVAVLAAAAAAAPITAQADVESKTITKTMVTPKGYSNCHGGYVVCVQRFRDNHTLGFAVIADTYSIAKVDLEVDVPAAGVKDELYVHNKDFSDLEFAAIQFDLGDIVRKLNVKQSHLIEGFRVTLQIKSYGLGGGRRDRCQWIEFRYTDDGDYEWKRAKSSTWRDIENELTFVYRGGGTVNDVKCRWDFTVDDDGVVEGKVKNLK